MVFWSLNHPIGIREYIDDHGFVTKTIYNISIATPMVYNIIIEDDCREIKTQAQQNSIDT